MEGVQLELPVMNAGRKVAEVRYFVPREPEPRRVSSRRRGVPQAREAGGRRARRGVRRWCGRLCRELLTDDGPDEGAVGVVGASAAASGVVERPYPLHERGHDRVAGLAQKEEARVERRRVPAPASVVTLPAEKELRGRAHHLPGSTSARR